MPIKNHGFGKKIFLVDFFNFKPKICSLLILLSQQLILCTVLGCLKQPKTVHTMIWSHFNLDYNLHMKLTARNDQVMIKSQSKTDFAR